MSFIKRFEVPGSLELLVDTELSKIVAEVTEATVGLKRPPAPAVLHTESLQRYKNYAQIFGLSTFFIIIFKPISLLIGSILLLLPMSPQFINQWLARLENFEIAVIVLCALVTVIYSYKLLPEPTGESLEYRNQAKGLAMITFLLALRPFSTLIFIAGHFSIISSNLAPGLFKEIIEFEIIVASLCAVGSVWNFISSLPEKVPESKSYLTVKHNSVYMSAMRLLGLSDARRLLFTVPGSFDGQKFDQSIETSHPYTSPPSNEYLQVLKLLETSNLMSDAADQITVGDVVNFDVKKKSILIAEICAQQVSKTNIPIKKEIFHGYLVRCDFLKVRTGKTFVSTDTDSGHFGHERFWNANVVPVPGLSEVVLEWNDFNELLRIASTNQVEAREILTPDFMQRLHEWWVENKGDIRLSFIDSRLFILFPSDNMKIYSSLQTVTPEAIRAELLSITRPLLPVLKLIETL